MWYNTEYIAKKERVVANFYRESLGGEKRYCGYDKWFWSLFLHVYSVNVLSAW